ncbi:hypothetical protein [Phenylobacterium sp.]|uniref:hypothetical protein n=1 Tax=Phenylobacterium sp. TaxID=1871053 RepID=UPI002DF55619|nr:hypothetical protein [Phenylobacterium sp.]
MDIHKPKPWHGFRDLLKEVGTIVIGVLIALCGEQAVEWLHWRHEVAETRKALDAELSHDLFAFKDEVAQRTCIAGRLAQIDQWVALKRAGRFTPLKSAVGQPDLFNLHFAIWEGATGEARAHIPLEARMAYAKLYDVLQAHGRNMDRGFASWDRLGDFAFDAATSPQDLQTIEGLVRRLRGDLDSMPAYQAYIDRLGQDLGIRPQSDLSGAETSNVAIHEARLCAPLL